MSPPNNAEQHQEAFCHPEQHEASHHQEAHDETLGAAAQQYPIVEAAAAAPQPQLSEGEKKALQIHNQGKLPVLALPNTPSCLLVHHLVQRAQVSARGITPS